MIAIDHAIPFPPERSTYTKYPFADLGIGDSFFVPDTTEAQQRSLHSQVSYQNKRSSRTYTSRKVANGERVWRLS
jgi:hypothetical protein